MFKLIIILLISFLAAFVINEIIFKISKDIDDTMAKKRFLLTFIITSILFVLSYISIGFNTVLIKFLILDCMLVIVAFIDFIYKLIPNKLVIAIMLLGALSLIFRDITVTNAISGMIAGGVIFFLLALVPGAIGGGDVKLVFALGLFVGLRGILTTIMLTFIIASVVSIILILCKIKTTKEYIPLGPFIAVGTFIAYFL